MSMRKYLIKAKIISKVGNQGEISWQRKIYQSKIMC